MNMSAEPPPNMSDFEKEFLHLIRRSGVSLPRRLPTPAEIRADEKWGLTELWLFVEKERRGFDPEESEILQHSASAFSVTDEPIEFAATCTECGARIKEYASQTLHSFLQLKERGELCLGCVTKGTRGFFFAPLHLLFILWARCSYRSYVRFVGRLGNNAFVNVVQPEPRSSLTDKEVQHAAYAWFKELDPRYCGAETASPARRMQFDEWLKADPRHAKAFERENALEDRIDRDLLPKIRLARERGLAAQAASSHPEHDKSN
jgi:hypothetical protein